MMNENEKCSFAIELLIIIVIHVINKKLSSMVNIIFFIVSCFGFSNTIPSKYIAVFVFAIHRRHLGFI